MNQKFIPLTNEEIDDFGWKYVDIVIISGDAYLDHPSFGTAVIARVLEHAGYRVAIIAQPDVKAPEIITRFGKPRLFFAVSAGNIDSLLAKYTAFKKIRNSDSFSPDAKTGLRPERAVIAYCNLIKRKYKDVPIIIGGLEASMRRFAHYDYWSNKIRRSIIEDARADLVIYGMGEQAIVEAAYRIENRQSLSAIPGTIEITSQPPSGKACFLPAEKKVINDKNEFLNAYKILYKESDKIIAQKAGNRYLIQYPSQKMETDFLDSVYRLPFTRSAHPFYGKNKIPALNMIQFSINSHRGCASGCAFCSIGLHQGKRIVRRSKDSILEEAEQISSLKNFKGHITDVGGPTANMYGSTCKINWQCKRISCFYPELCDNFQINTESWLNLLGTVKKANNVKHVTIGSGIRYDLFMRDKPQLLKMLVRNHISGQLKIAPEHSSSGVLNYMYKRPLTDLEEFVQFFKKTCKQERKDYYLIPYLMSSHPGCGLKDMQKMRNDMSRVFGFIPHQVQAFIPLPMTLASVMYVTGVDPLTNKRIFVEKDQGRRRKQHSLFYR